MVTKRVALQFFVLGILLLAMFPGCALPDWNATIGNDDREMVTITTNQLTLQWDVPAGVVDHYTAYYRVHGSSDWITLADVPADPQPEYTVAHSVVGDGEFDFAVVSVDASDQRSTYHTSLDTTAQPQSGWYVSWDVP